MAPARSAGSILSTHHLVCTGHPNSCSRSDSATRGQALTRNVQLALPTSMFQKPCGLPSRQLTTEGRSPGTTALTESIDVGMNVSSFMWSVDVEGKPTAFTAAEDPRNFNAPEGPKNTSPLGVNDRGQVVGWCTRRSTSSLAVQACKCEWVTRLHHTSSWKPTA
jgi:hypothetical protein